MDDGGALLTSFRTSLFQWLSPMAGRGVDRVVFSKWSTGDPTPAFEAQLQLIGVAWQVCDHFSIPFQLVSKARSVAEVAGCSRAPKEVPAEKRQAWISKRLRAGCLSRGFAAKNDLIAEAFAAVELYRAGLHMDHPMASAGPLFARAEA